MEINRIALYLAGKLPPYYQAPFDKYEFIEIIRANSISGFSDDFFKLIDSQDFYSMCLNRVKRANEDDFVKVMKKLNIKEDAGGLSKKDIRKDGLSKLKKELNKMKIMKKEEARTRGYRFEKWFVKLLDLFDLKPNFNIKNGVDQIDGSFILDNQIYIFEIEWKHDKKSNKTFVSEVSDKANYLRGTLGLAISMEGFTDTAFTKIKSNDRKNILLMSGENIELVLNHEIDLSTLICAIKRHAAEQGVPYLTNTQIKDIIALH